MFYLQLILAGIATGAIYSLAGLGVVLTYKGTGVFNFAHGAVAMVVAYCFWEMRTGWHWPLVVATPLALLLGAAIGLALERLVFRPLQRNGAGLEQKLVATLGVFTLLIGFAYFVWTGKVRQGPRIVTNRPIDLTHGLRIGTDQLAIVGVVVVVSILVWLLFRRTHLGTEIRAVVDRRQLAELTAVNANRVAGISWALGCAFAGLTGMLLATNGLDPAGLTLLVIETFSIAVVARLTSLPIAVASGVLLLGVAQSLLTNAHIAGGRGVIGNSLEQIKPNLSVVILFAALLIYRRLEVVGEDERPPMLRGSRFRLSDYPGAAGVTYTLVAVGFLVLPMFLSFTTFPYGHRMIALAIVFVSIVIITGFAGYITLGQGAFAGFGGFLSARMTNSLHVPVVPAMVIGALGAMVLGFLAGYPALRRKGLFLGLTTLGVALFAYSFIFQSTVFSGGSNGLAVKRPSLFGVSLGGSHSFYYFELACLGLMLLLARNVRSGRLGRILSAMRDSETAAASIGIDTRRFKLFVFSLSAFVAGMGGALLVQGSRVFEPLQFNPLVSSLVWFTVVIVAGVDTLSGALLGAAVFVLLDVWFKTAGLSQLLIGVAALSLGRLPGGSLLGTLRAAADHVVGVGERAVADAVRGDHRHQPSPVVVGSGVTAAAAAATVATAAAPEARARPDYVATDLARRLVARAAR